MKKTIKLIASAAFAIFAMQSKTYSQPPDFEWRLANPVFNNTDPDGAGAATGSVSFTLQIRTRNVGASIPITGMSTGFAWQDANAMVPTGVPCGANSVPQPSNIVMSPSFPLYTYNNVNHCSGIGVNFTTGGQTFDRRAVGVVDGGLDVIITNAWTDVFTATLWSKNLANPQAGFAVINSTNAGTPGPFGNYDISDLNANVFDANSLTYATPLPLGPPIVAPVLFTNYDVKCNDKGALLTWTTATEQNSDRFEIQRSENATDWITIDNVDAAGNSSVQRNYQYLDLYGGTAYYRVRQVDQDGRFIYTSVKTTNCKAGQFDVTLYPVPAKDYLTVVIRSDKAVRTELQILDINGRLIRRTATQVNKGNNNITLNVNDLPGGQYMLVSGDPSMMINKKFTIIR